MANERVKAIAERLSDKICGMAGYDFSLPLTEILIEFAEAVKQSAIEPK